MSNFGILPATQTIGSLDPHVLQIELPTYSEGAVQAAAAGDREIKPLQVLAHEMRHWFDIVGTVWGQSYPDTLHGALYFLIHAAHRKTAIDTAIDVLHDQAQAEAAQNDSILWTEATTIASDWVVESLIQGAWLREYHQWEIATKAYIRGQYARSPGASVPDPALWRGAGSHVDKVKHQLELFNAIPPACLAVGTRNSERLDARFMTPFDAH